MLIDLLEQKTEIDFERMREYFGKLCDHFFNWEAKSEKDQTLAMEFARKYFTRVTEVLLFLEHRGAFVVTSFGLPCIFNMPSIFNVPHLAVQRNGAAYDGKYYILDVIGDREEIVTEMRSAERRDIVEAILAFSELEDFMIQMEKINTRNNQGDVL